MQESTQHIPTTKILILGQTPPPYGGQAINIAKMVDTLTHHGFNYRFIRLNFSDEINDMGAFNFTKAWRLITIFFRLLQHLLFYQPDIVYYPPAGPTRNAIFRDMILLIPIRLFRFKVVFHYHAGGLSTTYSSFNPFIRFMYRWVYFNAHHSICLSESGTFDPQFLQSKQTTIVSSGVEDLSVQGNKVHNEKCIVLFAGLCSTSKGILDFIEVIRICRKSNPKIKGCILGKPFSDIEAAKIANAVKEGWVTYEGVQTDEAKNDYFRNASIFLFPSFFESENFPTAILEAFSAGLPVVATQWRGITDQVRHGQNGFLHKINDTHAMATSILELYNNKLLYQQLSNQARTDFETKYTMGIFEESIVAFFKTVR